MQVISRIQEKYGDEPRVDGAPLDGVLRFYNSCLLNYLSLKGVMPQDAKIKLVAKLATQYDNALSLGKDLQTSDLQHSDPFCVLMIHLLAEESTFDDVTLQTLIAILERALKRSPTNHVMKLLLINLYNIAGAVACSNILFEQLDIKHVQLDSLGYLMSTPLLAGGHYCLAVQLFSSALRFFTVNYKDVSYIIETCDWLTFCALQTYEFLITCYKYGSFTKVVDIIELREKLSNSLQFCASTQERMVIEVLESTR